jgi:penicillin-binding protein 1A
VRREVNLRERFSTTNIKAVLQCFRAAIRQAYHNSVGPYLAPQHRRHLLLALPILVFAVVLLGFGALFIVVYMGGAGPLPSRHALLSVNNQLATEVYAADSVLLGRYYLQARTHVPIEQMPAHLLEALVATEDARFYQHSGIDYQGLGRVFFKSLLLQDDGAGGGSTLSQQLAKNLYPRLSHSGFGILLAKTREMVIASHLEEIYSKTAILELYLNTVPFGDYTFGIGTASERFFSKKTSQLHPHEAAVLVGMLKANHTYNPRLYPANALQRRNVVLAQMAKYGYLSPATKDSLQALPLELAYQPMTHHEGLAPYFREQLRGELQQLVGQIRKPDGKPYHLYTDGLKVYTTLDSRMQQYAEQAVTKHMISVQRLFDQHWGTREPWANRPALIDQLVKKTDRYNQMKARKMTEEAIQEVFQTPVRMSVFSGEGEKEVTLSPLDSLKHYLRFLQTGMLAMEPATGHVKVWVGGINHKYFQYDHVNLQVRRQVGSTFKPVVYASALEQGADPCAYLANRQEVYEAYEGWSPQNADGEYGGLYSMRGALARSLNTIAVAVAIDKGLAPVVSTARALGITSPIDTVPAIALGAVNASLMEMVSAYATLSNQGKKVSPVYLSHITDAAGKVIWENPLLENAHTVNSPQAISPATAALMIAMLRHVVNGGTAASLKPQYGLYALDIAGKTGTTQQNTDGWFIGMVPGLVTGVWVGGAYPEIRFRTTALGQGAKTAMPIWGLFYQSLASDPLYARTIRQNYPPLPAQLAERLNCEDFREETTEFEQFLTSLFGSKEERTTVREKRKEERRKRREARQKERQ